MYATIRRYSAGSEAVDEARPNLRNLGQAMRQIPGFVAYCFIETKDGLATVAITENEAGGAESIRRAADWVRETMPRTGAAMGSPQITQGQVLLDETRQVFAGEGVPDATRAPLREPSRAETRIPAREARRPPPRSTVRAARPTRPARPHKGASRRHASLAPTLHFRRRPAPAIDDVRRTQ